MSDIFQVRNVGDEFRETFKRLAEQSGLATHKEVLVAMARAYENELTGTNIPERKNDLTQFQQYLNTISSMYVLSVQNGADQKKLAEDAVRSDLESKDKIIKDLQEREEQGKAFRKAAEEKDIKIKEINEKVADLEKKIADLTDQNRTLAKINDTLRLQTADKAQVDALEKKNAVLEAQIELNNEMIEILKSKTKES